MKPRPFLDRLCEEKNSETFVNLLVLRKFIRSICGDHCHISAACGCRFENNYILEHVSNGTVSDDRNWIKSNVTSDFERNFVEMLHLSSPKYVRSFFANVLMNNYPNVYLFLTNFKLKTYSEFILISKGEILIIVKFKGVCRLCSILVVRDASKVLMGRDLIGMFNFVMRDNEVYVNFVQGQEYKLYEI